MPYSGFLRCEGLEPSDGPPPQKPGEPFGPQRVAPLDADEISTKPIPAELMWLPFGRALHLVWQFQIRILEGQHVYDITVDTGSGFSLVLAILS